MRSGVRCVFTANACGSKRLWSATTGRMLSGIYDCGRLQCPCQPYHWGWKHRNRLVLALFRRKLQLQYRCWCRSAGAESLLANTNGDSNNAFGAYALSSNATGVFNQAMGFDALGSKDTGAANVAIGDSALDGLHGVHSYNTVIGDQAGADLTAGDD